MFSLSNSILGACSASLGWNRQIYETDVKGWTYAQLKMPLLVLIKLLQISVKRTGSKISSSDTLLNIRREGIPPWLTLNFPPLPRPARNFFAPWTASVVSTWNKITILKHWQTNAKRRITQKWPLQNSGFQTPWPHPDLENWKKTNIILEGLHAARVKNPLFFSGPADL